MVDTNEKPDLIAEAKTIVDYFRDKARVAEMKGFDWDYEGFTNDMHTVESLITEIKRLRELLAEHERFNPFITVAE